ncbi:RNA polymerase sigma-70 factor (ECF subfamily) [Paenibacillus shirakamiensis]|uniref:RNA polymerase sigma factor n=1 Tax=Paenibacillus shirakamiensis TaxID=1265935 RepID=A0ABS4JFM4_9BACL|nr:sigma-70 family RNA polymerase sigma factor [Paenibacillus shirakamiensis]MBP1999870.1 RNA polymerase sigma-70 factor (ECF subfamily) [Paenibacillus shirakamiensis]
MPEQLNRLLAANFYDLDEVHQEKVYYEFYDLVYGIILYIVKDHSAAEDIIQEAFLKVIKKKPVFDHELKMKAWLKVVSRNTAINYLRKNQRFRNHLDTDSVFINIETRNPLEVSVEQLVETKMLEEEIMMYLNRLKPEYKLLVEYRWRLGLTYREIADRLGTQEDIVRQRLYRARESVKKMLAKEWGDMDGENWGHMESSS